MTNTRATDPDSEGRLVQLVRASWFQLLTPGLLALIMVGGGSWAAGIAAKVDTIISNMAVDHERVTVVVQDVTSLKDSRTKRDNHDAATDAAIQDLKLQIALLKAGVKVAP